MYVKPPPTAHPVFRNVTTYYFILVLVVGLIVFSYSYFLLRNWIDIRF